MSNPSEYLLELQRLHRQRLEADTDDARDQADQDIARLMRLHAIGRDHEWFDAKAAAAGKDAD